MAFFTFRSGGRGSGSQAEFNSSAETIEAMRRRARHRLVGATVLVALGVVGFPLLFDTQPRPVANDIPIEIPEKNKTVPVALPATTPPSGAEQPAGATGALAVSRNSDAGVSAQSSLNPREQLMDPSTASKPVAPAAVVADKVAADKKPEKKPESAARAESDTRPEVQKKAAVAAKTERSSDPGRDRTADKGADKAAPAIANKSDLPPASRDDLRVARAEEAARARALLQGKSVKEAEAIAEGRFIVQIGAFSEPALAQAARAKAERAGLRTYTQETKTAGGTRIRVRVGPFATRAEANEAAGKIKGLSLPASILSL